MAISGTTVVVDALGVNNVGRAYVFTKTADSWKQAAELKIADNVVGDSFGYSVAISGRTVIVAASNYSEGAGRAYVFTDTANGWTQVADLKGSDTGAGDNFGYLVAISGTTTRCGCRTPCQRRRTGVPVHEDRKRLGAGGRAEGLRHRRRRFRRYLGGYLGNNCRRRRSLVRELRGQSVCVRCLSVEHPENPMWPQR